MAAALRQARDRDGIPAWQIEPFHVAFLGDVHGLAAKRDPERPLQSLRDDDGAVGDAVVVRIGELDDEARARLRRVDRVAGTQREITDALELVREDRNREPGRQPEGIIFSPTSALGSRRRGSATPENEHGCYDGAWPHRLSPTHDGYSLGANGTSSRRFVSRLDAATSRRTTAPFGPRNSSVSAGRRNRPHSAFWRCVIPTTTRRAPAS